MSSSPPFLVPVICVQNGSLIFYKGRAFSCNVGNIHGKDVATHIVEEKLMDVVSPELIIALDKYMEKNSIKEIKDDENNME